MLKKREMGKHRKEDEVPVKIFSPNGSYWYVSVHIGVYFVARSMLLSLSRVVVQNNFFLPITVIFGNTIYSDYMLCALLSSRSHT